MKKNKNIKIKNAHIYDTTESRQNNDKLDPHVGDLININYIMANSVNRIRSVDNFNTVKNTPTHVLLNMESSGVAEAKDYEKVLECVANKEENNIISGYWNSLQYNTSSANFSVSRMCFGTEIKMRILDLFYTLKNQLVYEFDWIEDELVNELKVQSVYILDRADDVIHRVPIDEMYYYYQTIIRSKGEDTPEKNQLDFQETFLVTFPFAEVLSTDISAVVVNSIYNAFFNILLAKASSADFETICNYIKPHILEFKDNLTESLVKILVELMMNRSSVDIDRYDFIKKLSEEFGNPFFTEF